MTDKNGEPDQVKITVSKFVFYRNKFSIEEDQEMFCKILNYFHKKYQEYFQRILVFKIYLENLLK